MKKLRIIVAESIIINWTKKQYLQKKDNLNLIVLTDENEKDAILFTGVCLPCALFPLGWHSTTWVRSEFKYFEGEATLLVTNKD